MSKNRKPMIGSKYYLPEHTFKMVVEFCYSYAELKEKYVSELGTKAQHLDGMPHGTDTTDPTYVSAERNTRTLAKIKLIEDTVMDCVGEVLYFPMLRTVTDKSCTWDTVQRAGAPLNRNEWILLKRMIHYEVAKKL